MLNARLVNAESSYFRRRNFANLFAFPVEFHDSKIPLNIRASFELTNRGRARRRNISRNINNLSGDFWRFCQLTNPQEFYAILYKIEKTARNGSKSGPKALT